MTNDKKCIVPIKQVCFTVNVSQGFADIVFHQKYNNEQDVPLEVIYMMPTSETFVCNKIAIDYTMPDGTVESIETKVVERTKGE